MGVSIVGTGNVAYHLVRGFLGAGVAVDMVYGRDEQKLQDFSNIFKVPVSSDLSRRVETDFYILAVKDSAIAEVASWFRSMPLVHTAGAVDVEVLSFYTEQYGVFYPFQTFRKEYNIDWADVPIFLESCCDEFKILLERYARKLSDNVHYLSTKKRRYLHLSGVLVNNFVNHLLYHTKRLLEDKGLKFEWTFPLLEQTLENIKHFDPYVIQTGPARRGDLISMSGHQRLLEENEVLRDIYNVLSHSILRLYHEEQEKNVD